MTKKQGAHRIEQREAAYWDEQAGVLDEAALGAERIRLDPGGRRHRSLLGTVRGKRLLDVGCGTGLWAVFLAREGADVWAIDISPRSIAITERRAAVHGVSERVKATVMPATALEFPDGFFDLVHGHDIIHHLEAAAFGQEIARALAPGGRAVFSENCANNPVLMFARDNLCGRWGIPKWSSDDEYPLTQDRLDQFSRFFRTTEIEYPQFLFLHYLDAKLFQYKNRLVSQLCHGIDANIFLLLPLLRKYSYRQLICCRR